MKLDNIINILCKFAASFEEAGFHDTAVYFFEQAEGLRNEKNFHKKADMLRTLRSSGAMSQYADLSFSQDKLLKCLVEEADKLIDETDQNSLT